VNRDAVGELLQRRIGLDPASLGATVVRGAVEERLRATRLDVAAYARRLADSPDELQALIEHVVVPETWFFRGPGLFEELAQHISSLRERPAHALSLACSTGEEPYSLAMALAEAGVGSDRCTIDGIDLSERSLAAARRGVYRELSFRQTDPARRGRHFHPAGDGWQLNDAIRERVRFRVGNLADPSLLAGESARYQVVLCRNVLIYLTPAGRRQALDTVQRLLAPEGLFAVGHAEPQLLAGRPFTRCGAESLFLFRFGTADAPAGGARDGPGLKTPRARKSRAAAKSGPTTGVITGPARAEPAAAEPPLLRARRLADANQLDAALAECQRLIDAGPTADAFSLQGVIHQARGQSVAAAEAFRKALYLDPNHREALAHSLALADDSRAAVLRDRLARLGPGGDA